jgi:hypothetical protein
MRTSVRIGALVASVAALLCASALAAGSMTATPITIDKATAPDVITLPDITVTIGNNLTYQDDLFIVVEGAGVDLSTGLPFQSACNGASGPPDFGYITAAQDRWHYRVTSIYGISAGAQCTFRELKVAKSSIGENCSINVRYEARRFVVSSVIDSAGPILVANVTPCGPPPPEVIEVAIDIKPGGTANSINPSSAGNVPVAILSSGEFDAPSQVVVQSLTFGRNALDPSLLRCNLPGEDVNKDGFVDLVCHFATRLAGFQAGDTLGFLVGKSIDGAWIVGWDSVRIVP